ncbi:MAG: tyrosine-type recombinase/integrase, partial [Blastocatellia bacterium]
MIQRRVVNRTEGKLLLKKLLREIEEHGSRIIDGDRLTFTKLAQVYEEKRLFEPTITPSGKTIGLKSYQMLRRRLKTLKSYFGAKRVKAITHTDIDQFKRERLKTPPTRRKTEQRSEADVNRDLQLLRNVLNFAVRQGWLAQNPFALGEPLISIAAEVRRERVLSREEEERLLLACTGPRAHLKPILICALDTAMRRGEMFKLCWKDVDLINREITVRAANAKTARARVVPISARLHTELSQLKAVAID